MRMEKMVDESCSNMEKIKEDFYNLFATKRTPEDSGKICYPG